LREFYGGLQFHIKTAESLLDKLTHRYVDINNIYTDEIISMSQPEKKCEHKEIIFSSQPSIIKTKPLLTRNCDHTCFIQEDWPDRLYDALKLLQPTYNLKNLQFNILEFEKCQACYGQSTKECSLGIHCYDNFKFLVRLSKHYQGIRTMLRLI